MPSELLLRQARAVEQAWSMAWVSLSAVVTEPRTVAEDTPEWVRVYTPGAREMLLNIVLRYRLAAPVTIGDIERVIRPYRQYRLPFQWWFTLGTEPAGLRDCLQEIGMQTWGGTTSMTLSLAGWEPAYPNAPSGGCVLHHALSPQEADAALQIICAVYFLPREPMARWTTLNPATQIYVAWVNSRPAAALTTVRHEGVVGIYHVATLPFARRQGIAGNLLIVALREAIQAGCTTAALTATPEARHLYEQLGFTRCGLLEQWVPGPALTRSLVYGPSPMPEQGVS
ncbi:MAG: GNAT family N-acetyltransferase [Ktedonobacterales bacterium]